MAASGGCSSEACSSLKKRALLEQTIVEGIRANCVVLVEGHWIRLDMGFKKLKKYFCKAEAR